MKETLIKCDRCGKEYTSDRWPELEYHGANRTMVKMLALVDGGGEYVNLSEVVVDLCPDCRQALRVWFSEVKRS